MITFTKEQLIASAHARIEFAEMMLAGELEPLKERTWSIELELARIALASLEAEPVAYMTYKGYLLHAADPKLAEYSEPTPLYDAPPAPVSVPECFKRLLHHAYGMTMGHDWNKGTMAGHHRDKLCQAVDECRATMLQGADGNSPVIPDGLRLALSNAGIAAPESDEMLAAKCEKHIQELVTWVKERKPFQPAQLAPDGWVACSERMPEREVDVQVYCSDKKEQMVGYMERNERDGYFRFASLPNGGGVYCQPTHWMPLPAAPQQETE